MDKGVNEPNSEFGYKPRLEFDSNDSNVDRTALWFAAAVFFAVIAAGVIIYRSGNSDFRTASIDVVAPAAAPSRDVPPVYSHIEGVDP
jgi:hypothetical protein